MQVYRSLFTFLHASFSQLLASLARPGTLNTYIEASLTDSYHLIITWWEVKKSHWEMSHCYCINWHEMHIYDVGWFTCDQVLAQVTRVSVSEWRKLEEPPSWPLFAHDNVWYLTQDIFQWVTSISYSVRQLADDLVPSVNKLSLCPSPWDKHDNNFNLCIFKMGVKAPFIVTTGYLHTKNIGHWSIIFSIGLDPSHSTNIVPPGLRASVC